MNILVNIWTFFQVNILTQPAFFIGLIVLLGYMLLRRPFYESIAGFIKATVGYLILNVAAGGLVTNFRPILAGLKDRFNLQAAVIDPYFGQAAAQKAVEAAGRSFSLMVIVLLIAFMVNLTLVLFRKYTKVRTVFITGHIMVQQSSTALWLVLFAFPQMRDPGIVVLLGLLLGTYWSVFSNLTVEPTQRLTEGGGFAVGHQQMLAVWVADKLAPKIGNAEDDIEHMKLPPFLSILKENVVATSILMFLFFGIIMTILGKELMMTIDTTYDGKRAYGFYILEKSLMFAVYLNILQLGVRMFVSELTESFQGISNRLLPGSMPAIDCAATYAFAPGNAVTLGFLAGAIGQFLMIMGLLVFHSPVMIITGFVPVFFDNATLAVFANKRGGLRAAMVIPFLSGILQVLGGAFAAYYFQTAQYGGWHGNIDWDTLWPAIGVLMKTVGIPGVAVVILAMLAIPQIQYARNKRHYFMIAEDYEQYQAELAAEAIPASTPV